MWVQIWVFSVIPPCMGSRNPWGKGCAVVVVWSQVVTEGSREVKVAVERIGSHS